MKVVFLLTAGLDRPVGARYLPIGVELVRRGHQVRVLALHPDWARCRVRRYVDRGVQVWYVGQMHARKGGSLPGRLAPRELLLTVVRSTYAMTLAALVSPADLLHLGKPQPINGVAGLVAARLRGLPLYVDCDDDERASGRFGAAWQRQLFGWFEDHLPPQAAGLTVNTSFLRDRWLARGFPPERIVRVPNGVDPQRFVRPAAPTLDGLRTALGLAGRQVIGYAGALALQNHPVDLLIDAFARLAAATPQAALLLIGGGEDLPLLRRMVDTLGLQDRVYFTGHVPRQAVPAYLSLAALSVDPVRDDDVARARSPLKLVESLSLGVPVITGAVGDRPELLANGAGFLCPPGDAAALAVTIEQALARPDQLRAASLAARAAAQRYDWRTLAATWLSVYAMR